MSSERTTEPADRPSVAAVAAGNTAALLLSLFVGGLAMRLQLVSIGPLVPRLSEDLATPAAVTGLLVTLPVMCMAIIAIPAEDIATITLSGPPPAPSGLDRPLSACRRVALRRRSTCCSSRGANT